MARRGRQRSLQNVGSLHVRPPVLAPVFERPIAVRSALSLLEDRRLFHPGRDFGPARSFSRRDQARVVIKQSVSKPAAFSSRVQFAVPAKVVVCVRRHQRKEVLHALGKAGGKVSRRRRRNSWSHVDC